MTIIVVILSWLTVLTLYSLYLRQKVRPLYAWRKKRHKYVYDPRRGEYVRNRRFFRTSLDYQTRMQIRIRLLKHRLMNRGKHA